MVLSGAVVFLLLGTTRLRSENCSALRSCWRKPGGMTIRRPLAQSRGSNSVASSALNDPLAQYVRFGSKADICTAPAHVRFTPNCDRESRHPQTVMSALPPKADMCGALRHVCFGPKADSCTAAKRIVIQSPRRRGQLAWTAQ